ncbi:MAG: GNAT family N-acetyltransferase [Chloroflexota bacterium]|nr:GNAT family N-acetyltransferase [Chloroflexota bacterium]MDQ5865684.1 GNAT family N-acetyltransferase [Chloroflexota bacterium]
MKALAMPVTFRDITEDNFEQVIGLELADDQQGFVRSNLYSIAQSKAIPVLTPKAVYNEQDELVGFVLYRGVRDPDADPDGWLVRIMIDKRYQGRGYGRQTMVEIIRLVRDDMGCRSIGLSVEPKNQNARKLYDSLGFRETGEAIQGQIIMKLTFEEQPA